MRYRGGGIGHLYMQNIEPWLNSTGWGTAWPGWLKNREPDKGQDLVPQENSSTVIPPAQTEETELGSDEEGDISDSYSDQGLEEQLAEDFDGEDEEHPEDEESTDEDGILSRFKAHSRNRSSMTAGHESRGASGEETDGRSDEESDEEDMDFDQDAEGADGGEDKDEVM